MAHIHARNSNHRMLYFDREDVLVHNFDAPGPILDIGGGGEGVIGRLKSSRVVAIDINRKLLERAPAGPLKIVMDATDLQFLDGAFPTVTAFYTLMYIDDAAMRRTMFAEAFRVLAPGGRFLIWDAAVPPQQDPTKDIAVFCLNVKLPQEEIRTGYGIPWPSNGQGLQEYASMAQAAGFWVASSRESRCQLFLELGKT